MPKLNYRLENTEWEKLKKIADFYVRVNCFLEEKSFADLLKRDYQGIAGRLVGLDWRSYLQQVESKTEKDLKLLSGQSIIALKAAYEFFKKPDDAKENNAKDRKHASFYQLAAQQPDFDETATAFYELKLSLSAKLSSKEFLFKKEKPKTVPNKTSITKSDFVASFQNSIWFCYERHIQYIGRHVLKFETADENGLCVATFMQENLGKNNLQGIARFIAKDQCIAIALTNEEGWEYTHFLIRIDTRPDKLELCIGHKSFRNRNRDNTVTKAVILTRLENDKNPEPKLCNFTDAEIPEQVQEFFVNRSLNRLSSPHARSVFNLETLEEWLEQNKHLSTFKYTAIADTYKVRYRITPNDLVFKEDLLLISLTKTGELLLQYTHENNKGESYEWKGKGFVNFESRILSAYLKGPITSEIPEEEQSYTDDKPIFLMINVPPRETRKIEVLTGLAAAIRDGDQGSVGRLIVLTKEHTDKSFTDSDHQELQLFFDCFNDRAWVRPPISKKVPFIARINDLIEARIKREKRKKDGGSNPI